MYWHPSTSAPATVPSRAWDCDDQMETMIQGLVSTTRYSLNPTCVLCVACKSEIYWCANCRDTAILSITTVTLMCLTVTLWSARVGLACDTIFPCQIKNLLKHSPQWIYFWMYRKVKYYLKHEYRSVLSDKILREAQSSVLYLIKHDNECFEIA
jgi:hypothetical protein